jgi:hypothetical protein
MKKAFLAKPGRIDQNLRHRLDWNPPMKARVYQLGFVLFMLTPALAASPSEERGKKFALNNCAGATRSTG